MPKIAALIQLPDGRLGVALDMPQDDEGSVTIWTDAEKRHEIQSAVAAAVEDSNTENRRLSDCLLAMANAGPDVTAAAHKSVAYDIVMNLITPDIAEHQLVRRSATATGEDDGSCPECATDMCKHATGTT